MLLWNELQNLLYSWKYRLHQPTEQMPIQPIKHGGGAAVLLCVLHVYSLHLIDVLHRPGQLGTCIASVLFCCYCIYELCLDQGTCTRATTTCDGPRWNTLAHMLGQTIIQLHHPAHPLVSSCWLLIGLFWSWLMVSLKLVCKVNVRLSCWCSSLGSPGDLQCC